MTLFYFTLLSLILLVIIHFVRSFLRRNKNTSVEFFSEALRNENDGDYESAVINYEFVLNKFKKNKFDNIIRNKAIEKLKVLHAIIEYKNNLRFTR